MYEHLEDKLSDLRRKRVLVEKKIEMRVATLAEFTVAKEESRNRLVRIFEEESKDAKTRHLNVLRDLSLTLNSVPSKVDSTRKASLVEAKKKYLKSVEEILPRWKRQQLEAHHEVLRKLQFEKDLAQERRAKQSNDRLAEEKLKIAVEQERRELKLMLALEQRDQIRSNAQAVLLRAQGRAVDDAIAEEMEILRGDLTRRALQEATLQESTHAALRSQLAFSSEELSSMGKAGTSTLSAPLVTSYSELRDKYRGTPSTQTPERSADRAASEIDVSTVSVRVESPLPPLPPLPLPQSISTAAALSPATATTSVEDEKQHSSHAVEDDTPPPGAELNRESAESLTDAAASKTSLAPVPLTPVTPVITLVEAVPPAGVKAVAAINSDLKVDSQEFESPPQWPASLGAAASALAPILRALESLDGSGAQSDVRAGYAEASKTPESSTAAAADALSAAETNKTLLAFTDAALCGAVLHIARAHGGALLPSEVFNGVVTLDKLRAAHKKLGGGRSELWSVLVAHMRTLVELSRVRHEEISKVFTAALVSGVQDAAERGRKERKVLNLLPLAILPDDDTVKGPSKALAPLLFSSSFDDSESLGPRSPAGAFTTTEVPVRASSSTPRGKTAAGSASARLAAKLLDEEELYEEAAVPAPKKPTTLDRTQPHNDDEFDF